MHVYARVVYRRVCFAILLNGMQTVGIYVIECAVLCCAMLCCAFSRYTNPQKSSKMQREKCATTSVFNCCDCAQQNRIEDSFPSNCTIAMDVHETNCAQHNALPWHFTKWTFNRSNKIFQSAISISTLFTALQRNIYSFSISSHSDIVGHTKTELIKSYEPKSDRSPWNLNVSKRFLLSIHCSNKVKLFLFPIHGFVNLSINFDHRPLTKYVTRTKKNQPINFQDYGFY